MAEVNRSDTFCVVYRKRYDERNYKYDSLQAEYSDRVLSEAIQ